MSILHLGDKPNVAHSAKREGSGRNSFAVQRGIVCGFVLVVALSEFVALFNRTVERARSDRVGNEAFTHRIKPAKGAGKQH